MSDDYKCQDCGACGVRLWRPYNSSQVELRCRRCAEANQPNRSTGGPPSDQIGWLVPAVPTVEGDAYWGYTSVPQDRVDWWRALPQHVPQPVPQVEQPPARADGQQHGGDGEGV